MIAKVQKPQIEFDASEPARRGIEPEIPPPSHPQPTTPQPGDPPQPPPMHDPRPSQPAPNPSTPIEPGVGLK